jgi:uncharacterized protein DUF6011
MNAHNLEALQAGFSKLAPADQPFAASLIAQATTPGKKPLSDKQWYWVGKLAERAGAAKPAPEAVKVAGTFAGVLALFATASAHLKRPRIALMLSDGTDVRLSLAGAASSNPGYVYVRVGGEYAGKVSPAGDFQPFKLAPNVLAALRDLLGELAADPAGVASAYGKLTGACCFCSIALTDERSTSVGYGPICAGHYGLPWGEKAEPAEALLALA